MSHVEVIKQVFLQEHRSMKERLIHRLMKGHMAPIYGPCYICWDDLFQLHVDALATHSGIPVDKIKGIELGLKT